MADDAQDRTPSSPNLDGLERKEGSLDRAGSIKQKYNEAAQQQQQSRQTDQVKSADQTQNRPTSTVKNLQGIVRPKSALDRAIALKEHFNAAAQRQQQHSRQAKEGAQQASEKLRQEKHVPVLQPTGSMKKAAKQVDANVKLRALNETLKAKETFEKRQKSASDRTSDHDRDR